MQMSESAVPVSNAWLLLRSGFVHFGASVNVKAGMPTPGVMTRYSRGWKIISKGWLEKS